MSVLTAVALVLLGIGGAYAQTPRLWRVDLETGALGPLQTHIELNEKGGGLVGRSLSGALPRIQALPRAPELDGALFAFEAERAAEGYRGRVTAPWPDGDIVVRLEGDRLEGRIEGGLFNGSFSGVPVDRVEPVRDYAAVLAALDRTVSSKIFDPRLLQTAAYGRFRDRFGAVAREAADDLDFALGFRFAWTGEPFSHFDVRRAPVPAAAMMQHFDGMRLGHRAATVAFDGEVAVLRVETMMGNDTIEYIEAAYDSIAAAGAAALIIDLRGNGGGAFAVKPLVEHVLAAPLEAGCFVSQQWYAAHGRLPERHEMLETEAWSGWSIVGFWHRVQEAGLTRLRFAPAAPHFGGPVYVLLDGGSASATELAADALRASGRATLVGEKTPGHMLSQSPFDLAEGFVVFLPVADYASAAHGRIEGVGVPVDVEVPGDEALARAKALARRALAR